jgi:osmotically-inducible protein OsmY
MNGRVTLLGSAGSELQKQFITAWAKDIDGVEEVRNRMLTAEAGPPRRRAPGPVLDDASISAQVKVALLLHRSTESLIPRIRLLDGVVTLHGEVDSGEQLDQVTSLVASVQGVSQVNNRMTMKVR